MEINLNEYKLILKAMHYALASTEEKKDKIVIENDFEEIEEFAEKEWQWIKLEKNEIELFKQMFKQVKFFQHPKYEDE